MQVYWKPLHQVRPEHLVLDMKVKQYMLNIDFAPYEFNHEVEKGTDKAPSMVWCRVNPGLPMSHWSSV